MRRLLLTGGRVATEHCLLDPGWVLIEEDRIAALGGGDPPRVHDVPAVNLLGRLLAPGFIDMHVHGGAGGSVTTGDSHTIARVVRFHRAHGTTRILASHATAPVEQMLAGVAAVADMIAAGESGLVGSHLEGPFLALAQCGAQDSRHFLAPDVDVLSSLLRAGRGTVRIVTLAPELPGAQDLIRAIRASGAVAAFGHTDASYDETIAAIEAGATVATHLFNGMRPLHHRDPGPAGAALDRPEVVCEIIADLLHVHPAVLRSVFRIKAPDRVALVTDATAGAGLDDGDYSWDGYRIAVRAGVATIDGSLAGSTLTMAEAVRRAVGAGVAIIDAIKAAATTPARVMGIADEVGTIEVGKAADLVVLGERLDVEAVLVGGVAETTPPWWLGRDQARI